MSKKVNRMRFDKLKFEWLGRLGAVYAFKGIKDYEEWAMGLATPQSPPIEGLAPIEEEWMNAEDFFNAVPRTEKEKLYAQAVQIRKQLDEAIAVDDFEKADILQKTLDVIELKYNKL